MWFVFFFFAFGGNSSDILLLEDMSESVSKILTGLACNDQGRLFLGVMDLFGSMIRLPSYLEGDVGNNLVERAQHLLDDFLRLSQTAPTSLVEATSQRITLARQCGTNCCFRSDGAFALSKVYWEEFVEFGVLVIALEGSRSRKGDASVWSDIDVLRIIDEEKFRGSSNEIKKNVVLGNRVLLLIVVTISKRELLSMFKDPMECFVGPRSLKNAKVLFDDVSFWESIVIPTLSSFNLSKISFVDSINEDLAKGSEISKKIGTNKQDKNSISDVDNFFFGICVIIVKYFRIEINSQNEVIPKSLDLMTKNTPKWKELYDTVLHSNEHSKRSEAVLNMFSIVSHMTKFTFHEL